MHLGDGERKEGAWAGKWAEFLGEKTQALNLPSCALGHSWPEALGQGGQRPPGPA